jgi:hypothetical protein
MTPLALLLLLAPDDLLTNGSFDQWKDNRPAGWTLMVGARNGTGKESVVGKSEKGLALRGDAATKVWHLLKQDFKAPPGETFRLGFLTRTEGLRRESNQYVNHYAGLVFLDAGGKVLAMRLVWPSGKEWTPEEIVVQAPRGAARGEVRIFLSITGLLELAEMRLERLRPEDSFDALARHMDRYYSYFAHKKVDWKSLTKRFRAKALAAKDPAGFVAAIRPMLAELKDLHVWIDPPGGKRIVPWSKSIQQNFDFNTVARSLKGVKQHGNIGFTGRTAEGFGYVAIGSLQGDEAPFRALESAIGKMLDAPAMIVDLRANMGGDERRAQRIASIFADKKRLYAKSVTRAGVDHACFGGPSERYIAPREGGTYTQPVACLIGSFCMSSGEGFALMMKALPHVVMMGRPTRGSSGNPAPVPLPNGVVVWFSRWVAQRPDGSPLEDEGVLPDVRVTHAGKGDPTFDAATASLKKRIR